MLTQMLPKRVQRPVIAPGAAIDDVMAARFVDKMERVIAEESKAELARRQANPIEFRVYNRKVREEFLRTELARTDYKMRLRFGLVEASKTKASVVEVLLTSRRLGGSFAIVTHYARWRRNLGIFEQTHDGVVFARHAFERAVERAKVRNADDCFDFIRWAWAFSLEAAMLAVDNRVGKWFIPVPAMAKGEYVWLIAMRDTIDEPLTIVTVYEGDWLRGTETAILEALTEVRDNEHDDDSECQRILANLAAALAVQPQRAP